MKISKRDQHTVIAVAKDLEALAGELIAEVETGVYPIKRGLLRKRAARLLRQASRLRRVVPAWTVAR